MKKITLSQGMFALVDDEDFEFLSQWKWYAAKDNKTHYAMRRKNNTCERMHRVLTNCPKGRLVDHRDGNGLNNQKSNLWIPPGNGKHENNLNHRELNSNNKSGIAGVSWYEPLKKYQAKKRYKGKQNHIGYFNTLEEAAMAVVNYELK